MKDKKALASKCFFVAPKSIFNADFSKSY